MNQAKLGKTKVTEIAIAFVKTCQSLGYECNIYSKLKVMTTQIINLIKF